LPCGASAVIAVIDVVGDEAIRFSDVVFVAVVIALQLGLAAFVCWIPARRAMRLDPIVAMRED
jgi:ABC-type lipoprotein release transport system permease subunit